MTVRDAGMTVRDAEMTVRDAEMTVRDAGMTIEAAARHPDRHTGFKAVSMGRASSRRTSPIP